MKTEKPKMSDIAKALDISTISVSRALAGQEGVSEELRGRVLQKAGEMGYLKPKSLGDSRILVLHQKPFIQDNSNYSFMIQGMEKALQAAGCEYDMEFADKNSQEKLCLPGKMLRGAPYDGLMFIGRFEEAYVRFITQRIKNYVFYTGYSPSENADGVWYNFDNGAYKQCEYLIQNGHTRIGYLGGNRGYISKAKVLGIVSALEEHGLPADQGLFIYAEDFEEQFYQLLQGGRGPTAVICQWDYTAVKLIKYLYDRGIKVPGDLSVIGSGNTEMSALCIPALTTLELHIDYACEAAVELLLKRLLRPDKPYETVLVGSALVKRDSVRNIG